MERVISASKNLRDIVSISTDLAAPRPFGIPNLRSLLWAIGKSGYDYEMRRAKVKRLLDPVARNRIKTIIELQILKHELDNNRELVEHWTRMLESYGGE
jgi:hypothetical protein